MHQNEAANLSKVKVSTTFPSSSIHLLEAQNEKLLTEALLKAPKTSGFKIAWKSANIVRTKEALQPTYPSCSHLLLEKRTW